MQISFTQNQNINFGSTPIHSVNLKNAKTGEAVKAVFSRLDPHNPEDLEAMVKIKDEWSQHESLIRYIAAAFAKPDDKYEFFAIELPGKGNLAERIMGVVHNSISNIKTNYNLLYLCTNPKVMNAHSKRELKGVGETLVGESFNRAKIHNRDQLQFISCDKSVGFYNKSLQAADVKGHVYGKNYEFSKEDMQKYVEYCEKKYGDNFSATI